MANHRSDAHLRIQQDSGHFEWYTPADIIEAARATMRGIDLDPASSAEADEVVKAGRYLTKMDDSLRTDCIWSGNVWMNPPFSDVGPFVEKLISSYETGFVTQACVITYASLDTKWARMLMNYPRWHGVGRVDYRLDRATAEKRRREGKKKTGPTKASMVTYLGGDVERFVNAFVSQLGGAVDIPWNWHILRMAEIVSRSGDGR